METNRKRRRGDRKDAYLLRDLDAMHKFIPYLLPNRCDNEAVTTSGAAACPQPVSSKMVQMVSSINFFIVVFSLRFW